MVLTRKPWAGSSCFLEDDLNFLEDDLDFLEDDIEVLLFFIYILINEIIKLKKHISKYQ